MKKLVIFLFLALMVFVSASAYALTEGCGKGSGASAKYAYVVNDGDNSISQYTIGADGALTPMTPATVATGSAPIFVTVDPFGKYAYVANANYNMTTGTSISQYMIGADGALMPMTPATVATGWGPSAITFHPSGKFVYVANASYISQYAVGADGALTPMTPATIGAGDGFTDFTYSLAVDPSGRYAYVSKRYQCFYPGSDLWCGTSYSVAQYTIGSDGTLSPMTPAMVTGVSTGSIVVDPSGKYAYVANDNNGYNASSWYSMSQYTIGADGTLTPMNPAIVTIPISPVYGIFLPWSITIDPSGKYAYMSNRYGSSSAQYTIGVDGALTPMNPVTVPGLIGSVSITVDPLGKYAYATGIGDWRGDGSGVLQYAIGADGALTPIASFAAGAAPVSITTVGAKCQDAPPSSASTVSGTIGNNGWYVSDVTVSLTATGSSIKEIHYGIDNGAEVVIAGSAASASITTDGTHSFTHYAKDNAGNEETPHHTLTVNIDKTPPAINITGITNGATYVLGAAPSAGYSATDNLSGVASQNAVLTGGSANNVGMYTYTVNATDKAGNAASLSATYSVAYNFSGFLTPVSLNKPFKLGSTIPVKFQLTDAGGSYVSKANAAMTIQLYSNAQPVGDPIDVTSTSGADSGNAFRYDATGSQYIYNLSTNGLSAGTWMLMATLDDGTVKTAFITMKAN